MAQATYNINKAGMSYIHSWLRTVLAMHGRVAFYAAISEETAEQETVVKAFKEPNPASDCVQVIVIDKDFTEHKVLISGFPQTKILKCLENNLLEPFPCSPKKQPLCDNLVKSFKVFCACPLLDTGDCVIKCDLCCEWYHYPCVGLEEDEDVEGSWLCTDCKSKEEL